MWASDAPLFLGRRHLDGRPQAESHIGFKTARIHRNQCVDAAGGMGARACSAPTLSRLDKSILWAYVVCVRDIKDIAENKEGS